jgi:hypothetical protein
MTDERTIRGELESYLKERDLNEYFTSIIESCLLAQPENPSMHITKLLFEKFPGQFPFQVCIAFFPVPALFPIVFSCVIRAYLNSSSPSSFQTDWPSPERCRKGRSRSPPSSDGERRQGRSRRRQRILKAVV